MACAGQTAERRQPKSRSVRETGLQMAINWRKYGLVAKPGPEGGPYIIEPKTWEQIEEFLAELKAHDEAEKFNKVVIAVDFKTKSRKAHKEDPDMFWKL